MYLYSTINNLFMIYMVQFVHNQYAVKMCWQICRKLPKFYWCVWCQRMLSSNIPNSNTNCNCISSCHYFCNVDHDSIYSASKELHFSLLYTMKNETKTRISEPLTWDWSEQLSLQRTAEATAQCILKKTHKPLYMQGCLYVLNWKGWAQERTCAYMCKVTCSAMG